jgi:HlyD family secretion protein
VEQQKSQAEAAQALLSELRAQPRKENLEVARAQVEMAQASLKTARDALDKQQSSYKLNPESVSKDALDNAINAQKVAEANLEVVTRQYDLTKAGAWVFDIQNQEKQAEALGKAYGASSALLAKYTISAPSDGVVLSIDAAVGSYVSPQGAYDTYTQGFGPVVVMGAAESTMDVRCYIDEILIPRLPPADKLQAQMFIRGTNTKIPLEFVRVQPYVSPKIQLSNERLEKVDLRVLPVIFRFKPPSDLQVFPGEMVDVYIGGK